MNNDELRVQDALIDRIDRALADGTGEVLAWSDENPVPPWETFEPLDVHPLDGRDLFEGDDQC